MKKLFYLFILLPFLFSSCDNVQDDKEIDPRTSIIGDYSCLVADSWLLQNGNTKIPFDNKNTYTITIKIDNNSSTGIFINDTNAKYANGKIFMDDFSTSDGQLSIRCVLLNSETKRNYIKLVFEVNGTIINNGTKYYITGKTTHEMNKL